MDATKNLAQHVAFALSFFVVQTVPQRQIILFPILALASIYFIVTEQAWKFPFKLYNMRTVIRVGILGTLTFVNFWILLALAQAYDPIMVFLAIPNYLFILAIIKAVKRQTNTYQLIGLMFWAALLLAEIYNFGMVAPLMALIVSVTINIRDNIVRSIETAVEKEDKTTNDYKLYSCIYLLSAFFALLTAIITLEFELYFNSEYVEHKSLHEFAVIVAIFAATTCAADRREAGDSGLWVIAIVSFAAKLVMIQALAPTITCFCLALIASQLVRTADGLDLPLGTSQQHLSLMSHIMEHADSRSIFLFFMLNLAFMFVEALWGYWCNSVGLISDAAHMAFDCTALFIGLYASYMGKFPSDKKYSYGYGRFEVLFGFLNGIFLVWVAFAVLIESVERLLEPPEVTTENLLLVSVLGLIVNLIGLYWFHDLSGENMEGVFLHVLADALGSVGVIVSSILVQAFGWYITDPICSTMISILIFMSTFSLLQDSAKTLSQQSMQPKKFFRQTKTEIGKIPGVKDVNNLHAWRLAQGNTICSLSVVCEEGTNYQETKEAVNEVMAGKFESLTIEILKEKAVN